MVNNAAGPYVLLKGQSNRMVNSAVGPDVLLKGHSNRVINNAASHTERPLCLRCK
jgi:hypothetical protein